jgi:hypothetical protein
MIWLLAALACAAEPPPAPPPASPDAPSAALLLYLGEFDDPDHGLIDPLELPESLDEESTDDASAEANDDPQR